MSEARAPHGRRTQARASLHLLLLGRGSCGWAPAALWSSLTSPYAHTNTGASYISEYCRPTGSPIHLITSQQWAKKFALLSVCRFPEAEIFSLAGATHLRQMSVSFISCHTVFVHDKGQERVMRDARYYWPHCSEMDLRWTGKGRVKHIIHTGPVWAHTGQSWPHNLLRRGGN